MTHPAPTTRRLRAAIRHLALAATVAVVAPVGVAILGPMAPADARPAPVHTTHAKVRPAPAAPRDLGGHLPAGARAGAITGVRSLSGGLAVIGASWRPGALAEGDRLQVRTRQAGVWGAWEDMPVDDAEHAPDPDTAEGRAARPGTAPVVVEGEGSQVRVVTARAAAPTVDVTFVDPGTSAADASPGDVVPGSASAAAARPTIYTRKDWGADESLRKGTPQYGQVQVGIVHHTAGSNSYTPEQVPAIIRGIYDFHVNGRGWSDVGYQFFVDRFGRIWEGRAGGVDKAVLGAQAGGYNSGSFGASVMGDFTSAAVPSAVTTALTKLFAWKFTLHGIPATGRVSVNDKVFDRISGHRDANQTSCPGANLYAKLPGLRASVAARIGSRSASALRRSVDAGGTPDVLSMGSGVTSRTAGSQVLLSASPQPVRTGVRVGTGWNALRHVVLTPDLTGDGRADIVAVRPTTGALRVYRGDGHGGFAGMSERGRGWNVMTALVAAGDRTGDGRADLLAVRNDGALVLYEGDGSGWLRSGRVVATGFGAFRSVTDAGDVTGDGHRDLLAVRDATNVLELYPGRADGGIGAAVTWGTGWKGLDAVTGADLDRDGRGDLLVRQSDGRMRAYFAEANGRLTRMNTFGRGWGGLDDLTTGADWTGDGVADLVARVSATGDLRVYAGTGQRDFSPSPLPLTTGVSDADLVRVVGDVDGDGLADAVARTAGGDLIGLRGRGDGRFDRLPTRIGAGWQIFDLVEPVGDYTNDGIPDLVARTTDGALRVYAMTRGFGVAWQLPIGTDWQGARSITATGAVNADVNSDVVVLRTDGSVRLYRGTGPGALNYYSIVLTGQTDLVRILGTGDYTGDGPNDILGQAADGRLYVYPGDGKGGFRSARQPVRAPSEADRVLG
jgi:N-acetylmuramoyl-L-alanine amidase/FG-GAP-like repeat